MFNEDIISDIIMKLHDGVQVGECPDKIYAMCFLYAEYISNQKVYETIPETFFIIDEMHEATISIYLKGLRESFSHLGIPIQSYSELEGEAYWMRGDKHSFTFHTHNQEWIITFSSQHEFSEEEHIYVDGTNNNHMDKKYMVKEKVITATERFMREHNASFGYKYNNYIPLDTQKHIDDMNTKAIDIMRTNYSGTFGIPISDTNPLKLILE